MDGTNERRPALWAVGTVAVTLSVLGATGACNRSAGPRTAHPTGEQVAASRPTIAQPLDPALLDGHWHWSHLQDDGGVRRIENEHWVLKLRADTLRGHYDRVVTFISLDGVPFECSQALTYRLKTRYQILGTVDSRHFRVAETDYTVTPSPCEGGYRHTGEYRGSLVDGKLVLAWDGGRQTLARELPKAEPPETRPPSAVAGAWRWINRSATPDETVRVESEEWQLDEAVGGTVTGTYLRTVTVFDPEGTVFACSGDTYYRYRDRYTVHGSRNGRRLIITETDVDAERNPCLVYTDRHLDAATGTVGDGYIDLEWRGRHHQILHRPRARSD